MTKYDAPTKIMSIPECPKLVGLLSDVTRPRQYLAEVKHLGAEVAYLKNCVCFRPKSE